jgi:serine/threonine protein kinase
MCRVTEYRHVGAMPVCHSIFELRQNAKLLFKALSIEDAQEQPSNRDASIECGSDVSTVSPNVPMAPATVAAAQREVCDSIQMTPLSPSQYSGDAFFGLQSPVLSASRTREACRDNCLWYRSPEHNVMRLFSSPVALHASPSSAEMWVAGCLFAEMAHGGKPLFSFAETEFDLLNAHCDVVGFRACVEGVEIGDVSKGECMHSRALKELVPNLCDCGFDLLSRMLCCDWNGRINARDALQHPFFTACTCETSTLANCYDSQYGSIFDDNSSRQSVVVSEDVFDSMVTSDCFGQTTAQATFEADVAVLVKEHRAKKRAREACASASTGVKRTRIKSVNLVRCE